MQTINSIQRTIQDIKYILINYAFKDKDDISKGRPIFESLSSSILSCKSFVSGSYVLTNSLQYCAEFYNNKFMYCKDSCIHSAYLNDEDLLSLDDDYMFNLFVTLDTEIYYTLIYAVLEKLYYENNNHNRIYFPKNINSFISRELMIKRYKDE